VFPVLKFDKISVQEQQTLFTWSDFVISVLATENKFLSTEVPQTDLLQADDYRGNVFSDMKQHDIMWKKTYKPFDDKVNTQRIFKMLLVSVTRKVLHVGLKNKTFHKNREIKKAVSMSQYLVLNYMWRTHLFLHYRNGVMLALST
jgi:hypothetical protein